MTMPDQNASASDQPALVPVGFKSLGQLYRSFMPFLKNTGLFVPTRKRYLMGQEVLLMVQLPGMQEKLSAAGEVVWVNPENAAGHKKQGVGVEFTDGNGATLRIRIEGLLVEQLKSDAPTYTL